MIFIANLRVNPLVSRISILNLIKMLSATNVVKRVIIRMNVGQKLKLINYKFLKKIKIGYLKYLN